MNKKNLFRTLTVAAFAALTLSACNNAGKMDEKPAAAQTAAPSSLKIAFIEVDSIIPRSWRRGATIFRAPSLHRRKTWRQPSRISRTRLRTMDSQAKVSMRANRLPFNASRSNMWPHVTDWLPSSKVRPISSMQPCTTVLNISSPSTTKTRNSLSSSPSRAITFSMVTNRSTSPMRLWLA